MRAESIERRDTEASTTVSYHFTARCFFSKIYYPQVCKNRDTQLKPTMCLKGR